MRRRRLIHLLPTFSTLPIPESFWPTPTSTPSPLVSISHITETEIQTKHSSPIVAQLPRMWQWPMCQMPQPSLLYPATLLLPPSLQSHKELFLYPCWEWDRSSKDRSPPMEPQVRNPSLTASLSFPARTPFHCQVWCQHEMEVQSCCLHQWQETKWCPLLWCPETKCYPPILTPLTLN